MIRNLFNTKQSCAVLAAAALTSPALAQHSHGGDIEFGYENGMIAIEFGTEGQVFEADLPLTGGFEQNTDDPGFTTNAAEGLLVGEGDAIDFNILGPLLYHDGSDFAPLPIGANLVIEDNGASGGTISIDGSTVGPGSGPGRIADGDASGNIHAHIEFTLAPNTLDTLDYGAYGLLMELTTSASGIANSESFFIVFNFGLEEDEGLPGPHFHDAVEDFAAAVPEPGSLAILAIGGLVIARRRGR